MAESKPKKARRSCHGRPEEDRISNLPDHLLFHILSFISSKTSVQTSILSPRWRHLWQHVSVLNLSDDHDDFIQFSSERFKHFRRFFYFVNSLIYVIRPYTVHKFRLSCTQSLTEDKMCSASLGAWFASAMGPLIKELDITLYTTDGYCFQINISECSKLVSLSLKGALSFSWYISLPSLKKLVLDIHGIGDASLNRLLEGCPCLETLDLYLYVDDYGRFCVPPLRLPSSLKILKIIVKHLGMSRPATKKPLLEDVTHLYFSKFDNLVHLNLNLLRFNSNLIMSLLQECHSLEVLIIQNDKEEQSSLPKWATQSSVPSCLESHLSFIQFKRYRGFTDELYFAEYILQKGCVLKTMIIVDISTDPKKKFDTLKRLSNVSKASKICQLTFN